MVRRTLLALLLAVGVTAPATVLATAPALTAAAAAAAAPALSWGAPTTVDPYRGRPQAVSCLSTGFCMVVDDNGRFVRRTSSGWTAPAVIATLGENQGFSGVSCRSSSFCMAVDTAGRAFRWNGSTWALSLTTTTGGLGSVSCGWSTFCVAAGGRYAYRWDGAHWSAPATLVRAGTRLLSVSCAGKSFCQAVAHNVNGNFALRWNGSSWSGATFLYSAGGDTLWSVSCVSASFCVAAGDAGYVARWTSGRWSVATIAGEGSGYDVYSVSCTSPTFCVAAGNALAGVSAVSTWRGSGWSSPRPIDPGADVYDLSCGSSSLCITVDTSGYAVGWNGAGWGAPKMIDRTSGDIGPVACPSETLCVAADGWGNVLRWSAGTWSGPQRLDGLVHRVVGHLEGPTCGSPTFCLLSGAGRVFRFDGTSWSVMTSMPRVTLACASVSFCLGIDDAGGAHVWDGTSWHSGTSPWRPGANPEAISCPTTAFCMAADRTGRVGRYSRATHSWSRPTSLDPKYGGYGVTLSCGSASWCVAVEDDGGRAFRWTGSAWVFTADFGGYDYAVTCHATFCVAVGQGFSAVYDGTTWDTSSSATLTATDELWSVSCTATPVCTAVGRYSARRSA